MLSVILKSSHFSPTDSACLLNSGTYSSGSVGDLHTQCGGGQPAACTLSDARERLHVEHAAMGSRLPG